VLASIGLYAATVASFTSTATASEVSPAASQVVPDIGTGWHTLMERYAAPCVVGRVAPLAGAREGDIEVRKIADARSAQSVLGFEVGARARFSVFSGGMRASIAESLEANALSRIWVYMAQYKGHGEQLDFVQDVVPTIAGRAATQQGQWLDICGDEFVYQRQTGGLLTVVYRLDFDSQESMAAVEAELNAQFAGLGDVSSKLRKHQSMLAQHTALTIHAYQLGGEPENLGSIITGFQNAESGRNDDISHVLAGKIPSLAFRPPRSYDLAKLSG